MTRPTYEEITKDTEAHKKLSKAYEDYLKLQTTNESKKSLTDLDRLKYLQEAEQGKFTFLTQEDAVNFFQQQAEAGIPFIAMELGHDGEPSGDYMVSSGDGTMIQGKLDPTLLKQLMMKRFDSQDFTNKTLTDALKNKDEGAIKDLLQKSSSAPRPDGIRPRP